MIKKLPALGQFGGQPLFLAAYDFARQGMTARAGLTTPNIVEAETNRALVASATRVVVCADHTKWGVVGLASFGTLADVERVVTDRGLSRAAHEAIEAMGCAVEIACDEESGRVDGVIPASKA